MNLQQFLSSNLVPYRTIIRRKKPKKKFLVKRRRHIFLGDGEGEEGGVLRLGTEGLFECGALRRVCKSGLGRLRGCFERVLAGDILGVSRFGGVQQVDAQLLLSAGTTLKIERLGLVELTHNAGKHTM